MKLAGVRRLVRLEETDSTQSVARRLADEGAPGGTLVWALAQSKGKGRLGRRWRSTPGGLYVSWLIRPDLAPDRLADFSLACGAAAAAALRDLGVREPAVKPPNDVLARGTDGKFRKICGILCEASGDSSRLHWLIVGVGINVDNDPPLKRATSLKALIGRRTGLEPVLRALMRRLSRALKPGSER